MTRFTPELKHHILSQYRAHKRKHGFTALATKYHVPGGGSVVYSWHKKWDGTADSLRRKPGSGRPPLLTPAQRRRLIVDRIRLANRARRAIHYPAIRQGVMRVIHKPISIQTIRRLGRKAKVKQKRTCKRTTQELSSSHCDQIAECRRKIQRLGMEHAIFLDETHLRVSEAPRTTLVAPGQQPFVIVDDTTQYAKRYDMIACCTSKGVLPPMIFSPTDRQLMKVKGINKQMLLDYIHNILAQACASLDRHPLYLILDRARIHNTTHILEAFHEDSICEDMKEVILMPPQAAKRMSPLDNALFHDWKERCRAHTDLSERTIERIMADEWNNTSQRIITNYYKHCKITGRADVYADCPDPEKHAHPKPQRQPNARAA